jgi:hypothetical protein
MFKQDITFWKSGTLNEEGNTSWQSPGKVIKGRWEDKVEMARNADGEEVESKAVVYVPGTQEMEEDWRLYLGCFPDSDPDGVANAYVVIAVGNSPSVRNKRGLKKIWLA